MSDPDAAAWPPMLAIVGPTASGKTALALAVAEAAGAEILSCDSQQVYRHMDVGTGKASAVERARVPHHLLDVADPADDMTAARFVGLADAAIAELAARGRPIVICGGTGLYLRALMFGLFEGPPANPQLRAELTAFAEAHGEAALHARLVAADPSLAQKIAPADRKRTIRALEVFLLTGEPMSAHQARHDHRRLPPRYPIRQLGLDPPRPTLDARIDARVDAMFAHGLVAEVQALRARGVGPAARSQLAIGYAEVHAHLEGGPTEAETRALVQRHSRQYARRQRTWFRADPNIAWVEDASMVDRADIQRYLQTPPTPARGGYGPTSPS